MGSASPKESNSRHLASDSLVEWSLASAKANLVRVGHYELRILKLYCFLIGRQDVEIVQTTPFSIPQPLTSFGKAAPASPGNGTEVEYLHALGGAIALWPQADLQLSLASTELVAWVHDT